MPDTGPQEPDLSRARRRVIAAFGATLLGIVGLTLLSINQLRGLAAVSSHVADADAPSIAELATIRGRVLDLRTSARESVFATPERRHALQRQAEKDAAEATSMLARHGAGHPAENFSDITEASGRALLQTTRAEFFGRVERGDTTGALSILDTTREDYRRFDRLLEADIVAHSDDAHRQATLLQNALTAFTTESIILTFIGIVGALVLLSLALRSIGVAIAGFTVRHLAMEERARELDAFAGRVAHDLRGPLTAVKVSLGSAARHGDERTAKTIERANANIDVLNRMLEEMLDFARSGAKPPGNVSCNAASVLQSVAQDLKPRAEADRVSLLTRLAPGQAAIGELPLRMVAFNLVENAIKYIGDGAERIVEVTSRPDGARVLVEVRDTGVGIPPAAMPRLFDPFFRGRASGNGYGLGLATVKRLVEAHGGRVAIESAVGKGTVVKVSLPTAGSAA